MVPATLPAQARDNVSVSYTDLRDFPVTSSLLGRGFTPADEKPGPESLMMTGIIKPGRTRPAERSPSRVITGGSSVPRHASAA